MIKQILPFLQIGSAVILIILILLQQRGGALGSAFGGGDNFYLTQRGIQKKIFWITVVTGVVFVALALLNLIL